MRSPPPSALEPTVLAARADRGALAWIVGGCVGMHAASFGYGVISDDEAIYAAMAREVAAGGVMYRDTVDHKPPGIVATYALAFLAAGGEYARAMTLVHGLGLLVVVATALAVLAIGRRILAPRSAATAALLFGVLSAAKVPYDGLAVNGELLMNLPTALAVLAALAAATCEGLRRRGLDLLAGLLVGCAVLDKYQAGLVLCAMVPLAMERPRGAAARLATWGAGLAIPLTAAGLYFASRGALGDALAWGLFFNRRYLAAGPPLGASLTRLGTQLAAVVLPASALYVSGFVTVAGLCRGAASAKRDVPEHRGFLVAWVTVACLAVLLGGRAFGHYFLQAELPLAIAAAGPATRLLARSRIAFAAVVGGPALFFVAGGLLPLRDPGAWLDSPHPDYVAIGRAVQAATTPDQSVWVWGNVPQLYFTSERRAGARFVSCNFLTGLSPATPSEYDASVDPTKDAVPGALALALHDLDVRRPAIVVDTAAGGFKSYGKLPVVKFPDLAQYLTEHYDKEAEVAGAVLYRRVR